MATLLLSLSPILQPAIEDLGSSSASNAYVTFFKDVSYALYVRKVFTNITGGASIVLGPNTLSIVPIFVYIDGRDQVIYSLNKALIDAYDRYQSSSYIIAIALLGTLYLLIYSKFFNKPSVPVKTPTSCLSVDSSGSRFLQTSTSLVQYQIQFIIYKLIYYYIQPTKREKIDIYNINKYVELLSYRAVLNLTSYKYYASSIYLTQLLLL